MPQPTRRQIHVDAPLTIMSVAYQNEPNAYISDKVFPIIPVEKQSDRYFVYTKNDWFRDEAKPRGPGTESAGGGYNIDNTPSYFCPKYAWHHDVPDDDRANADAPLDPDRDGVEFVTERLRLRREVDWAANYFTTGVWGTDAVGVASAPTGAQFIKWSDYTNGNPFLALKAGRSAILGTTGRLPNKLVLGWNVYETLIQHPLVIDRLKYTTPNVPNAQRLAALFEVDEVLVAQAIKATNVEGEAETYSFIQGDNALLCYAAPRPGIRAPSAGYTFAWKGVSQGMGYTIGVGTFRMQWLQSDRIEGEVAFQHKVVGSDLGYFFSAVL